LVSSPIDTYQPLNIYLNKGSIFLFIFDGYGSHHHPYRNCESPPGLGNSQFSSSASS